VFIVVSTQAPGVPQSIWPATPQVQLLFTQLAPPGHMWPQLPQFCESFVVSTHAPPEHWVCPVPHDAEHALLLHTCVPEQVVVQFPQWLLFDETHIPLQLSSPDWQTHCPLWHIDPDPQDLPHPPQFCGSLPMTFTQPDVHDVSPEPHIVPLVPAVPPPPESGLAQLATISAHPRQATSADKKVLRASMGRLLLKGGLGSLRAHPTARRPGGQ
jgi:hypothetical protein